MPMRPEISCAVCGLRTRNVSTPVCRSCATGKPIAHGTTNTYRRGCRCEPCSSAAAADTSRRRHGRRAAGLPESRGTVIKHCMRCGERFTTRRHVGAPRYCSAYCRRGGPSQRWRNAQEKLAKAAAGEQGYRAFIAGECQTCGNAYIQRATHHGYVRIKQRCCSETCHSVHIQKVAHATRLRGKARRRALQHGAFVTDFDRAKVFEADGWKCHLCGKRIRQDLPTHHRMGPTIDHIIPLSKGGKHEPANLRAAHRYCNSKKCAGGAGEQFPLFV